MPLPEFADLFREANACLVRQQIESIQCSTSVRGPNCQASASWQPQFLQLTGQLSKGPVYVLQTANTQLEAETHLGLSTDSLSMQAILQVAPVVHMSLVDSITGAPARVTDFSANLRGTAAVRSKHQTATLLWNQRGNIWAGSVHQQLGPVTVGCEYVNARASGTVMQAVGASFTTKNQTMQVAMQVNTENSAMASLVAKTPLADVALKVQGKRANGRVECAAEVGVHKMFDRGSVAASVSSNGAVAADVKAVVGQSVLAELVLNGDLQGNVHVGAGFVF